MGFQVFADLQHVGALTDEGRRHEVDALFAAEDQVAFVFLGQRRQLDGDARQVNALVLAEIAVVQHLTNDFVLGHVGDFHADQTVVNQHGVADLQVGGEAGVGDRHAIAVTDHALVGGEGEGLAGDQRGVFTAFQFHGANFRAFGIQQDAGVDTGFRHHGAHVLDAVAVLFIVAVREVETHHVHARIEQVGQHFFRFGFWTDGTNNFGLFHGGVFYKL